MLNSFTTGRAEDALRVDEFYMRRLSLMCGAYVCLEVIDFQLWQKQILDAFEFFFYSNL